MTVPFRPSSAERPREAMSWARDEIAQARAEILNNISAHDRWLRELATRYKKIGLTLCPLLDEFGLQVFGRSIFLRRRFKILRPPRNAAYGKWEIITKPPLPDVRLSFTGLSNLNPDEIALVVRCEWHRHRDNHGFSEKYAIHKPFTVEAFKEALLHHTKMVVGAASFRPRRLR